MQPHPKSVTTLAALTLLALPTLASAGVQETAFERPAPGTFNYSLTSGWGFGVQAGVQGLGVHLRRDVTEQFYVNLQGNYFKYSDSIEIDDIDYDGKLDLSNLGVTLNYLPFKSSGFRITAGAFFGKNSLRGQATSKGRTVEIDDVDYVLGGGDYVRGRVDYDTFNPYLGLGWDWAFGAQKQFVFGFDLGVLYMGSPSVSLSTSDTIGGVRVPESDRRAAERELRSEIDDYRFLPVLKIAFTYRF